MSLFNSLTSLGGFSPGDRFCVSRKGGTQGGDYVNPTVFPHRAVFARIAPLPHLKALRDQLMVFIKHFLTERGTHAHRGTTVSINDRIKIAEQALRTEKNFL